MTLDPPVQKSRTGSRHYFLMVGSGRKGNEAFLTTGRLGDEQLLSSGAQR